jgi:hypothetical protein
LILEKVNAVPRPIVVSVAGQTFRLCECLLWQHSMPRRIYLFAKGTILSALLRLKSFTLQERHSAEAVQAN